MVLPELSILISRPSTLIKGSTKEIFMSWVQSLVLFASVMLTTNVFADQPTPTTQPSVLFKKDLNPDIKLRVVSKPISEKMMQVVAPNACGQGARFSSVSVVLVGNGVETEIGSALVTEFDDARRSIHVLDVFVGNDEVVVGFLQGDLVALWCLPLNSWAHSEGGWVWIRPHMLASASPLPLDAMSISMSASADGLWLLKTQLNVESVHPIIMHFQQSDPHEWKFIPREVEAP